jgi:hypothetical protein
VDHAGALIANLMVPLPEKNSPPLKQQNLKSSLQKGNNSLLEDPAIKILPLFVQFLK